MTTVEATRFPSARPPALSRRGGEITDVNQDMLQNKMDPPGRRGGVKTRGEALEACSQPLALQLRH